MLLFLFEYLAQFETAFTVFQYLTLRTILSAGTALAISLMLGPWMIRRLNYHQVGQAVRDDGPESHLSKAGTPTMGGALILVAIAISSLLWSDLRNDYVWIALLVVTGILMPNVNNWAHGVGFVSGFLLGFLFWRKASKVETMTFRVAATGCMLLTIGTLIYGLLFS